MDTILLAGATGYLGRFTAKELAKRSYHTTVLVRNPEKLKQSTIGANEVVKAEVTRPDSIKGCCDTIDAVISTIGITRQKDGLTYMDVDYQANMNLLQEAKVSGVKKFIYVSVLNGQQLRHLKICDAKETFVEQLEKSGLDYCVIRPNGFFSDMAEFYEMAKKGRVYLFGNGGYKTNPIHAEDLAKVCVGALEEDAHEIDVGGPEILTHNEIAEVAFKASGGDVKITYIPEWVRKSCLGAIRLLTGSKVHGPIEFFMTVMAMDMVAPRYGKQTLKEYFTHLK